MSRRAPSGPPATERRIACTLHSGPPYRLAPEGAQVAKHYTRTRPPRHPPQAAGRRPGRPDHPLPGRTRHGTLADLEPGRCDRERQLKQRGAARRCHLCTKEARAQHEASAAPAPDAEAGAESEAGG